MTSQQASHFPSWNPSLPHCTHFLETESRQGRGSTYSECVHVDACIAVCHSHAGDGLPNGQHSTKQQAIWTKQCWQFFIHLINSNYLGLEDRSQTPRAEATHTGQSSRTHRLWNILWIQSFWQQIVSEIMITNDYNLQYFTTCFRPTFKEKPAGSSGLFQAPTEPRQWLVHSGSPSRYDHMPHSSAVVDRVGSHISITTRVSSKNM